MTFVTRGARPEDWSAICALADAAFKKDMRTLVNEPLRRAPFYGWEDARVLVSDDEIISVVVVARLEAHLSGARVPFGYVGPVATHPDHQRRGHMTALMAHAHAYLRERGFVYALLQGRWSHYGSLGYRDAYEKQTVLGRQWRVPTAGRAGSGVHARLAEKEDAAFLSSLYLRRNASRFGPVVREKNYWEWSLQRTDEGEYVIVSDIAGPFAYFHIGDGTDELAWEPSHKHMLHEVVSAVRAWAARKGQADVTFWGTADVVEAAGLGAFGDVPASFSNPLGQPVNSGDPTPYRPENWPEGWGRLVRWLNPGPGLLSSVGSTDDLTDVMARYSWTCYDADLW